MMTNNHEINGKKMDQEDATIRDEKGRFTSGTHGGPGRGKSEARAKLAAIDDLIDLVEEAARDGIINSKDLKDKLTAAKVGLKVAELKKSGEEVRLTIPPVIQAYLDLYKKALAHPGGWEDVVLWISKHCTDCPKLPGRNSFTFDHAPGPGGDDEPPRGEQPEKVQ